MLWMLTPYIPTYITWEYRGVKWSGFAITALDSIGITFTLKQSWVYLALATESFIYALAYGSKIPQIYFVRGYSCGCIPGFNACIYSADIHCCSMAPARQSARQKAMSRAQLAAPASRLATAAEDATAELRRDFNELRDLIRSVLPGVATAAPEPVAGPSQSVSEPALLPMDTPGAGSVAPPWPDTADIVETVASNPGIVETILNLPGTTQNRVSRLITNSLSIHSHVPHKLRVKIWADEFVDMYSLLPEVALMPQEMTLTVRPGGDNAGPSVCVAPKPKADLQTFYSWSKAFDIFCSVYLIKPANNLIATKLFQYRHLIRNLMERGGDWRGYDESFRTMRTVEGWNWDEMHSQLWLMAAQRPVPKVAPQVKAPFLARGASTRVVPGHCTKYNTQGSCSFNPCKFRHQCSLCGGGHPAVKCHAQKRKPLSSQRGGFRS